ncbi:P-loop containing nucleoside triphosphate hydrolase protein [Phaeosphaeria sp. MPI-PUGE-AT-0046c]|nr:P-loop containing nucleoside triphosphate hydrolase protein [Phaeosphaeria sp. MPI-PUGE-AT-0046c]
MDRFYLENMAKYHSLVGALDPTPKPRASAGKAGPNMVVSARIRPLSEDEGFPSAIFPRQIQENVVDIHDLYNHPKGIPILKSFDYEVDRLYGQESTTNEIYQDLVADLVPFAWNGGIGTLFAYGQTGSGKTYTVSRLEESVAETLLGSSPAGKREIHMTIIDLAGNAAFDLLAERKPISLLEDSLGTTQLVGAEEHLIHDKDEMIDLIHSANSFRQTAATFKNDASSRSHAICRIRIRDPDTNSDGLLYLIDLAGSEGARDIASHGADRMRETREINISLSVLKDCIRIRAQADTAAASTTTDKPSSLYVPFRQSALTRVLKHVFDPASNRPCKTVVIACVNPSLADVGPSKNTFRFAEMLRVLVPAIEKTEYDPEVPMTWDNGQVRDWIASNSGSIPILPHVLAPRESGAQLLRLSDTEFEYRCQKCPGVKLAHARAFRLKLWTVHVDAQHASKA